MNNLKDYKNFIDNLNEDQIDSVGDDYTSCWLYALYVHNLLGLPISDDKCETIYSDNINNIDDFLKLFENDGIYSFHHANKTEFHYFFCTISGCTLTLNSTYGGQSGIINKIFDKYEWIYGLINLFTNVNVDLNEKLSKYRWLFGITNKIENVDLSTYIFMYISNKDKQY